MSATKTVQVEFDDQRVERTWNEAAATMDWTPFTVGYGILLNERYQFPMDMALVRMKLDTSRQLFVDNHVIYSPTGLALDSEGNSYISTDNRIRK